MKPTPIDFKDPAGLPELLSQDSFHRVCRDLAIQMARKLDEVIREAINNHLGREDWALEEVRPRLEQVIDADGQTETICMDGEPIFRKRPLSTKSEDGRYVAEMRYAILNKPPMRYKGGCPPTSDPA